jgi:hypothetical protein
MSEKYILNSKGAPVRAKSLMQWAKWFESADRSVARESLGDSEISTVFLALDHNFFGKGPPILWETMVFGGVLDQDQDRCSGSREQAEAMHQKMVLKVRMRQHLQNKAANRKQ